MHFGHFIDCPSNFLTLRLPIFLASDNFQLTDTMCLLIALNSPKNVTIETDL